MSNGKTKQRLPIIDSIVEYEDKKTQAFEIVLNLSKEGEHIKFMMLLSRREFKELAIGLKEFWELMTHED